MNKIKVAINGFGRIGRMFFRLAYLSEDIEIVVINDLMQLNTLSHLLKYDSVHRTFHAEVKSENDNLFVDGREIQVLQENDLDNINWKKYDIDVVIECTGKFRTKSELQKHINSGAKKVILSSPPSEDSIKTIVMGVNDDLIREEDLIISNASCTTNSAAPLLKIIDENWEIESAYITTVHSFTNDQNLHDSPHQDLRRARSATSSIIPTTTGAAKALTKIFPSLDGKIGGCGIRVPVANASLTDLTCVVRKDTTIQQVNEMFQNSENPYLDYTNVPIVSVDIIGNSFSSVLDSDLTSVIGKMIKVVAWYDNESGYSNRLIDLLRKIS
ncbi:type I glyceraldehyde-3-phosphate dehydrogenase [Flavobacteriales bacterium]|nr:type I glyceraldehyde-3-phosphate dehydrogenase [Flavobacteriales bacterium]